jgi:hypothetical protein
MYDIDESGAAAYSWNNKVKGLDITDPVMGGVSGCDNAGLTTLALRTKQLQDRLTAAQSNIIALQNELSLINTQMSGIAPYTVMGKIGEVQVQVTNLQNAQSSYAVRDASNLNSQNTTSWLMHLGIQYRAFQSGCFTYNGAYKTKHTIPFKTTFTFSPDKHSFHATLCMGTLAGALQKYMPIVIPKRLIPQTLHSSIDVELVNAGGATPSTMNIQIHWVVFEKLF